MTAAADGTTTLRFRNGSTFTFVPGWRLSSTVLTAMTDTNGNVTTIVRNPSDQRIITKSTILLAGSLPLRGMAHQRSRPSPTPLGGASITPTPPAGSLSTFTNVLGGVTKYTYDSQNRLLDCHRIHAGSSPKGTLTMRMAASRRRPIPRAADCLKFVSAPSDPVALSYVLINSLVPTSPVQQASYQDPLGNVTTYRFNSQGYVIGATDPTGQTRTITRASGTNLILSMTGSGTCPRMRKPGGWRCFIYL